MTMMTIFRDLPIDLVEDEILCYVPPTYLKQRLQFTCKRWNRLFNGGDSRFARQHTDKAAKQFLVLMVKDYRIRPTIVNFHGGSVEFKNVLSLVDSQSMDSAQFNIYRVCYCDSLLLCTSRDETTFVVWNPFTGETRWFQRSSNHGLRLKYPEFVLGYYQDDNNKKSYKVLRFSSSVIDAEIYDFRSDSWRTLDRIRAGFRFMTADLNVSLKGNTYCFATDSQCISLLKFDFQTEKYVVVPLPYQCRFFESRGLSALGEKKLSVLLQRDDYTFKTEIWVTNKIDEINTQVVSWTKVLALDLCFDLQIWGDVNFLLDEEKKVIMMSVEWVEIETETGRKHMIYTVGVDGEVTQVELGPLEEEDECFPKFLNYVPSLVQIEQAGGKSKNKRGDLEQAGGKSKRKRGDLSDM